MSQCKNCGSSDVETSCGEIVCNQCGAVLERAVIVSEVQFQENAAGFSTVVGQFISYEGGTGTFGTSRQITIRNARERITNIAHQLDMTQNVDMAVKFYKLANSKHLTKGRISEHVAAACLYIVCRIMLKPIMLLDFSDKVKVDVYKLGRIYRFFAKELHIEIPFLDPCLYIERYARRLEFGDKTMEVCKTANRLVSSMSRDWMVEGRRPSGICGAALVVAARIFNFNRTIKDVIRVVRIGERTIKNRLKEFEQTESSKMTIEDFHSRDAEVTMDPPCYTAGLKKAKMLEENKEDLAQLLEETEQLKNELEQEIEDYIKRQERRQMNRSEKLNNSNLSTEDLSLTSVGQTMEALDEELAHYKDLLNETTPSIKENRSIMSSDVNSPTCFIEEDEDHPEVERIAGEMEDILNQGESFQLPDCMSNDVMKESLKECLMEEDEGDENGGDLNLDGINDEELDEMLLTEDEIKIKTVRWFRENMDYLKEKKEKDEKKAQELLLNPKGTKPKRKMKSTRGSRQFETADEAIENMLKDRDLKNKVNYEALIQFNLGPRKLEPAVETGTPQGGERLDDLFQAPPEKKARLERSIAILEVQKHEAESDEDIDDDDFYFDKDDQENQPDNQQDFMEREEEPADYFNEYYDSE